MRVACVYTAGVEGAMRLFEEYPPSMVVFGLVALVVTFTLGPACGVLLTGTWALGHWLDNLGVRRR